VCPFEAIAPVVVHPSSCALAVREPAVAAAAAQVDHKKEDVRILVAVLTMVDRQGFLVDGDVQTARSDEAVVSSHAPA
jgi:hypothetical protein